MKSEIINEMQVFDYLLEDDSKYRLCFTKELKIDAGTAFLGQVMLGYSQGKKPKEESVYNLSQTNNGIKIIEFSSVIWFRDSYGTIPERMDMKANNAWFNAFYNILQKIKTNIESSPNSGAFKEGKIDIETKKEDEKKESIPEGLLPKSLYGL